MPGTSDGADDEFFGINPSTDALFCFAKACADSRALLMRGEGTAREGFAAVGDELAGTSARGVAEGDAMLAAAGGTEEVVEGGSC